MPSMRQELADVFVEIETPAICSKRAAHDQLSPILQAVATLQQQVARHREKLLLAEMAEGGDDNRGQLERLHQTLGALDTDLKELIRYGRRVALSMGHLERYGAEIKADVVKTINAVASVVDGAK